MKVKAGMKIHKKNTGQQLIDFLYSFILEKIFLMI